MKLCDQIDEFTPLKEVSIIEEAELILPAH
jgi:hypothetical protein